MVQQKLTNQVKGKMKKSPSRKCGDTKDTFNQLWEGGVKDGGTAAIFYPLLDDLFVMPNPLFQRERNLRKVQGEMFPAK